MRAHAALRTLGAYVVALGCVGEISAPERLTPPGSLADVPLSNDHNVVGADVVPSPDRVTPPAEPDPGRVTLHRLNRAEYNATVRDLFGTTRRPADDFPVDDRGYGFDNIADVLSMSTVQMELYQRAAEALVDEALANPGAASTRRQYEAESLTGSVGAATGTAWNLWSNGELPVRFTPSAAGRYVVTVRAWQTRGGPADARMSVERDGALLREFTVPNVAASPGEFTTEFRVTGTAPVTVAVSFLNDYHDADAGMDRNLLVDWIRIDGPTDATARNPQRDRVMVCTPSAATVAAEMACAREVIARFGRRAWRRPLTDAEVTELANFLTVARTQGEGFEQGVKLALQATLLSANFIFRVELDAEPTSLTPHPLSDHELASRLSYFVWSSMPDDALFALADAGTLHEPAVLRAQVERMIADPRARALTDNFAGQWLFTRAVAEHDADAMRFPGYTEELRSSLRAETQAYFEDFLRSDVGMDHFLDANFTFVDDRLARFYGITAPGTGMRRVTLDGASRRAGLLTQASLLTVTSHPDRTSPVRRGAWVLNQLLCEPPQPPPPSVEGLPVEMNPSGSLRQRMERHRADPNCATCHDLMDPLGFAFEHFDAVGAWRMTDSGFAIDTTGTVPGSSSRFDGAIQLAAHLARDERYPRCVTQHWFTYALGRGPDGYDQTVIDDITRAWSANGLRLRDLVTRIALSDSFKMRRGEPVGGMR